MPSPYKFLSRSGPRAPPGPRESVGRRGGGETTTHPLVVLLEGLEPGCVVLALAFLGVRHPCLEAARTRGPGYPRLCLTLVVSLTTDVFFDFLFFLVEVLRELGVRFVHEVGCTNTYLCVQASGFGTLRPAGAASAVWLLSELSSQVDTSKQRQRKALFRLQLSQ